MERAELLTQHMTGRWVAALADCGATAIVTLNALRLCASRAPSRSMTGGTEAGLRNP